MIKIPFKKSLIFGIIVLFLSSSIIPIAGSLSVEKDSSIAKLVDSPTNWYIPTPPVIDGPRICKVGEEYTYTFCSIDLDSEKLCYWIEWGDGTYVEWAGPFASGEKAAFSHTWTTKGSYKISAQGSDYWFDSEWAYFSLIMPKTMPSHSIFQKLLERFPHAFTIWRHLLKL